MTASARTAPARFVALAALLLAACDSTKPAPPPPDPVPVSATPTSDQQVDVSWGTGDGSVTEIHIERTLGAGAFMPLITLAGALATYSDTGLSPATSYRYRVQACSAAGCSGFTPPVTVSTFATLLIDSVTPPSVIAGDFLQLATLKTTGGTGRSRSRWRPASCLQG